MRTARDGGTKTATETESNASEETKQEEEEEEDGIPARGGVKTALYCSSSCSLFPFVPLLPSVPRSPPLMLPISRQESRPRTLRLEKEGRETSDEDEIQEIYAWMIIVRSIQGSIGIRPGYR